MQTSEKSFFERVYQVVRQVPPGKVTTYGHIARFLGTTGSARMVGWAMNQSHSQKVPVPAHRVVNRNGLLTGKNHFQHADLMEELLKSEGIEVKDDQIKDFERKVWDPAEHLKRS
jgi:methylated-DNA-protein-cysteine methyltransferase related protein